MKYSIEGRVREKRKNSLIAIEKMDEIVTKILEQPFGAFTHMNLDFNKDVYGYKTFEKEHFRKVILRENKKFWGDLTIDFTPPPLGVTIEHPHQDWTLTRDKSLTQLIIDLYDYENLYEEGVHTKLLEYLKGFIPLFEQFDSAALGVTGGKSYPDFYTEIGINVISSFGCFNNGGYMEWVHIMSPSCYDFYFTKEVLLNAPCYKTQELENGVVLLMNYENPFSRETEDTIARIKALNKYFLANNKIRPLNDY